MIRIEKAPWGEMLSHALSAYPDECCGAMIGRIEDGLKVVSLAVPLENATAAEKRVRYELRPEDLLQADRHARDANLELIGIYHSHPDCDAYFSTTDLKNSCPWYSFVVLSIKDSRFSHACSWLPNDDQTRADKEELSY